MVVGLAWSRWMLKSICSAVLPVPQPPAAASAPMIVDDSGATGSAETSWFQGFGASKRPASVVLVVPPGAVVVVVALPAGTHWQSVQVSPGVGHGLESSHASPAPR